MPAPKVAPYGSWESPITTDLIVAGTVGLGSPHISGDALFWTESRPSEGGRIVLVRRGPDGTIRDVTPPGFNVRTRVHEYGGGAFTIDGETVYFSNFADSRLYRQRIGEEPRPITPETQNNALRYADFVVDRQRNRLIAVREDHTDASREAVNTLVSVPLDGQAEQVVLVSGNDFYSSPRLSPDGAHLSWLTWNHPNMPWDGTELWTARIADDGTLVEQQRVAGGTDESIFQPEWSPDGTLTFVSDRSGWWNLYQRRGDETVALHGMEAEFGQPQWTFGTTTYGFASPQRIVATYLRDGLSHLATLDLASGAFEEVNTPYTTIGGVDVAGNRVAFIGSAATRPGAVVVLDLASGRSTELKRSTDIEIDAGYLSTPEPVSFPTTGGRTAYGFFYPTQNKDFMAPKGEKPPLLVEIHGGPTAATTSAFNLSKQFWTSRGVAVLDVNYGGSTGYGREFRNQLRGQWGIVDIDDCVNGAQALVDRELVDGNRLAITGGSAGGYTTLAALTFRDVFKAGTSYFGVSDIEALARDTHKFESRYIVNLVGPYPERADLFHERSPLYHTDQLNTPVAFFQGLDDKIVPPNQAEMMVEAIRSKGLPVAYVAYEGEGHGFRKAENIKRSLEGELYFYSRVFGFPLAGDIQAIAIENLG